MKAMILAAGLGTRLGELTQNKPKALVELNGKPMLEHVILKLKSFGISEIIINVHHYADMIEHFVVENQFFGCNIVFSDERNELLDTGGGLFKASEFFSDGKPFLLYNTDIYSGIDLSAFSAFHKSNNPLVSLAVKERNTGRCFLTDEYNQICGWKNSNSGEIRIVRESNEIREAAFSGIHIIDPVIFSVKDKKGRFSLTELYLELAKDYKLSCFFENSFWFDLGKSENIAAAENHIKLHS